MKTVTAFAPGHISGFFQPITESNDVNQIGSRGAGVCISHGATVNVQLKNLEKQKIHIQVNGKQGKFPVTTKAIKTLIGKEQVYVEASINLDLPMGQGFGMSAASALSSSLAVAYLLDKPRSEAVHAAHLAEVSYHTGLGDVCTAAIGGFEIRKKPGIPPFGDIQKINEHHDITLGVFPGSISTRKILTNNKTIEKISTIGAYCTDQVTTKPSVQSIMKYSYYFTKESGLAPKPILDVLKDLNEQTLASMCMLGHSVFIIGNNSAIINLLTKQATVIHTTVDTNGARLLKPTQ